jgi:hypothetical protein
MAGLQGTYLERFVEGAPCRGLRCALQSQPTDSSAALREGCGPLPAELQRLLSTLRELDDRMTGALPARHAASLGARLTHAWWVRRAAKHGASKV